MSRSDATPDPIRVLAASNYLAPLSEENRRALAEIGRFRRFEADDVILPQAEPVLSFFVVAEGRAKKQRAMPNGRQVVLGLYGPGLLFGTADAIGRQPSHGSLIAMTDLLCLEIRRDELFGLMRRHGSLASDLLVALTPHLSECKNCIVELACLRIEARLARLLGKLARSAGYEENGHLVVPIALSRQDLADMTGTTVETTIRIMSRWGKENVVETRDQGFVVHDVEKLTRLGTG